MEGILKITSKLPIFKSQQKASVKDAEVLEQKTAILEGLREISKRKAALQSAFDLETDFELIDSYILELDALEKRYSRLFKLAKMYHVTGV